MYLLRAAFQKLGRYHNHRHRSLKTVLQVQKKIIAGVLNTNKVY